MKTEPKTESRLSRAEWLQHSLEVLRDEGIQGVKINRLASDLGVTKGSFYWHFTDLADLRQSLLEYWFENFNESLHATEEFSAGDPAEGLLAAMTQVREAGLDRYELAMRAWAEHDAKVRKVVLSAYQSRIEFIGAFYRRMGFRGNDVDIRVRLMLCYMSWEPNLHPQESKKQRLEMLKLQHQLLTRR